MKQTLFLEVAEKCQNKKLLLQQKTKKGNHIRHYHVLEKNKKELKRDPGDYFSIQFTKEILKKSPQLIQKEFHKIMQSFLKKYHKNKTVLVVGLGNSDILVDSFGARVTDKMIATNQYNDFLTIPKIALLNPNVMGKTGISSFKLIQLVVKDLNPDVIIILDSLSTSNETYLNQTIEISDTGIIPGSALRTNKEINKNTFHIPILSIGVPFMYEQKGQFLESIYLKQDLEDISSFIAESLNQILMS